MKTIAQKNKMLVELVLVKLVFFLDSLMSKEIVSSAFSSGTFSLL